MTSAGATKDKGSVPKKSAGPTKDECRRYNGRMQALQRTIEGGLKREEDIEYTFTV
jgi:hypothetical protein